MPYGTVNADLMTTSDGVSSSGLYGFKNRIINGAMVIDQRNAGASVTPTDGQFSVDRWKCRLSQSSKYSFQQNAGSVTPPVGFTNYLGFTSLSSFSPASGDFFNFNQPIEGFNLADLGWGTANAKTVTLSFQVYSSLTGLFGARLLNASNNRYYIFTYTVSSANTWTTISVTIDGDTTGTWGTTNGIGISLAFDLGSGSTFDTASPNNWGTSDAIRTSSCVRVIATNTATFYITGVQLEKGSTATSFDYRPYGTELGLCQRYFISIGSGAIGANNSGGQLMASYAMPVDMRVVPSVSQSGTITVYGPSFADYNTSTPVSQSGSSVRQSIIAFTGASGGSAGIASRTYGTGVVLFSSEL
jgi:hypothetical protein